jgi:hypothetical protein
MIERWTKAGEAKSVGLLGNAADVFPELVRRGVHPDIVTDQTSAHDPINGYLPKGWTMAEWRDKRESDPAAVEKAARASMKEPRQGDGRLLERRRPHARLWQQHPPGRKGRGSGKRLRVSRLRAGLYPPAVLQGYRSVPLVCAVGRPGRHLQDRPEDEGAVSGQRPPAPVARHGARADRLSGPARAHLLDRAGRPAQGRACLQRDGQIGRAESPCRHRPRSP